MRVAVCGAALAAACVFAGCARHEDVYVERYRALHPAVAYLQMRIPADDPKRKGQWDDAFGSGVVVASDAHGSRVLTDAHVVAGARDLTVTLGDGPHAHGTVVATSGDDDDLALVDVPLANRPVAPLGSTDGLEPGSPIGLLGYPIPDAFEDERLGRTLSLYAGRLASVRRGALELDVPVIPGESGGPVFAVATGAVIGVAQSRFDEERAIGFAIPAEVIRRFLAAHDGAARR